ncbi:DUF819 domain-containing protein, partial [Caldisericum sp.]|uniref:DUF819 family protein n=1 Tax=Caldisericum sp. TaxID=2499687 RepID=UPI003D130DE0
FVLPLSVAMLLFNADLRKILRESGRLFVIFNISALGTVIGAFVAVLLYHRFIPDFYKAAAMMTGSYIGGGVNFVALSKAFEASGTLVSTLIVADNLNMAIAFLILLAIPNLKFFKRTFKHPYDDKVDDLLKASKEAEEKTRAAAYWKRKEISLLDIASTIAIAFLIVFISVKFTGWIKSVIPADATGFMSILRIVFGQLYLFIPIVTIGLATLFPKWLPRIPSSYEIGMFMIYLFFVVIGIPASLYTIITKAPILLAFCATIAIINIFITLIFGKIFHFSIEECVLSSNANLGGPSTAAGMAIAKGWTDLITPAILVGVWGYAIGNYVGIFVGLTALSMFH